MYRKGAEQGNKFAKKKNDLKQLLNEQKNIIMVVVVAIVVVTL